MQKRLREPLVLLAAMAVVGYGWWASGVHPFTWRAQIAVGIPSAIAVAVIVRYEKRISRFYRANRAKEQSEKRSRIIGQEGVLNRGVAVWVALLGAFTVWEVIGLLAGGSSRVLPTFSDLVDNYLLRLRLERFVLFILWLWLGKSLFTLFPSRQGTDVK
jgi:hypothetical protein